MPIYDSDGAAERFAHNQWRTTEFWEKARARESFKRRMWVLAAVTAVILLSGIPVTWDRRAKWATWAAARTLASQIQALQREAAQAHHARKLIVTDLTYKVFEVDRCDGSLQKEVRTGNLLPESLQNEYALIRPDDAKRLELRPLSDAYCYDPGGSVANSAESSDSFVAFVFSPKQDLERSAQRHDRWSWVTVSAQGEVSF